MLPSNSINTLTIAKNAWLADLSLEFSLTPAGTQLSKAKRLGPLSIQKAFYPEDRDCAHIYLLHPPAGIVSGDELNIQIINHENAHSLITTPGANRFYRARDDENIGDPQQFQTTSLTLAKQAKCENFPLETIVYEGAQGFNTVDVKLADSSIYLGWDITCLGLPSSNQPFVDGQYTQLNRIFCDDVLIYHDRITVKPNNNIHQHIAGLNQHNVFATFIAYANVDVVDEATSKNLIESLRELIEQSQAEKKISISQVRLLLIIRYLGEQADECKLLFIKMWQQMRPIYLDKAGTQPRIWHT